MDLIEVSKNIRKRNWSPFLIKIYNKIHSFIPHSGINVVEEEWDYLLVLDASRYDFFEEVNEIEGKLEKKISPGAQTDEWLNASFPGNYNDIVYVSANPHVSTAAVGGINPERFHDYYLPYMKDECMEYGATKAECVNEAVREAAEEYPDKRIVVHYIQPHAPYIGEKRIGEGTLYELYSSGVSKKEIRGAYRSNLKYVLGEIEGLIPSLEGKIVITSDHGEMLGEKGVYGHKSGLHMKELVDIPWLEVETQEN